MAKTYNMILVAVALHDSDSGLVRKALDVAGESAQLTLLHVCEQGAGGWGLGAAGGIHNAEMVAREEAFPVLKALAQEFGLDLARIHIEVGEAAQHIDEYAKRLKADLIVTGSHARHGWRAHLGSVATAVVNGAPCDVLTVRLRAP